MNHHKNNLTKDQKQVLAPFIAFELTALFIAWKDIWSSSSFRHGNRVTWLLISLIQPIGPWLYLWLGRDKAK